MKEAFDAIDRGETIKARLMLEHPGLELWEPEPEDNAQANTLLECKLPPVLDRLADFLDKRGRFPQKALARASALTLFGTLLGGRLRLGTGARPNLYVIGTAHTGQGKDAARRGTIEILDTIGASNYYGGDSFSSTAGVYAAFATDPLAQPKLVLLDEIGNMLAGARRKNAASHKVGLVTELVKAFYWSSTAVIPKAITATKSRDDARAEQVHYAHLSVYATGVPDELYRALDGADLENGVLNRFLIVEGNPTFVKPRREVQDEPSAQLVEDLKLVVQWAQDPGFGLPGFGMGQKARVVRVLGEAWRILDEFETWICKKQNELNDRGDPTKAIFARTSEKAQKLALILAAAEVCENPDNLSEFHMSESAMRLGAAIAREQDMVLAARARAKVGFTKAESLAAKVLWAVREAPERALKWSPLMRKTRVGAKEMRSIVATLEERGDLKSFGKPNGKGKDALIVVAVKAEHVD